MLWSIGASGCPDLCVLIHLSDLLSTDTGCVGDSKDLACEKGNLGPGWDGVKKSLLSVLIISSIISNLFTTVFCKA